MFQRPIDDAMVHLPTVGVDIVINGVYIPKFRVCIADVETVWRRRAITARLQHEKVPTT